MTFKIVGFEKEEEKLPSAKFKIVGVEEPTLFERARKQIKGKFVTPAVEATAGFLGVPGELAELLQKVLRVKKPIKTLPTGADLKRAIETLAGEEFEPTTSAEQKLAKAAGLGGRLGVPVGGQIQAGRALVGALLGTGLEELAESAAAPEAIKAIAGTVGAIAPFLAGKPGVIKPRKPTKLGRIAERERIAAPKAAVVEKFPKRKLQIAKATEKTAQRAKAFEKSVERAKDRIIEGVTPLAKNESAAQIAKREGGAFLNKAEETAKRVLEPVLTTNIENALDKNVRKLLSSPALSTQEKGTLKFLKEIEKGLKTEQTGIFGKFDAKNKLSNLTALNRSLNKEIKFLKPTTTGDRALLEVKDALMKDIEAMGPLNKKFFKEWKTGNKLFAQGKKFEQIREALSPAFTEDGINFNKFRSIFRDVKKQKSLVKLLGKEQFGRLKDISKLGKVSADTFTEISKDPRIFRQLERMGNIGILGVAMGWRKTGLAAIAIEKVGVRLLRGYMGRVMTDPKFSKNYLNLIKAVKIGSPKAIITTAKRVNEDIERTKKDIKD